MVNQLGIGDYGPIYDAEVKVKKNLTSRALIKVAVKARHRHVIQSLAASVFKHCISCVAKDCSLAIIIVCFL